VTWPRAAYLTGHLVPDNRDAALFIWDFWWMARSVTHLSNPWFTRYLAAPAGSQLGFHTLMPLPGVLMTPVTLGYGPSFSYNLLSVAAPALMCYAMYRVARLWLPSQTGAIAAGAFFGLSTMMTWNAWWELNLALGAVFLPAALEAAVRLRRRPGWRQGAILGVVLGVSLLTDQESTILAVLLTAAALLPWLARRPAGGWDGVWVKVRSVGVATAVTVAVASLQIIAMTQETLAGNAGTSQSTLDSNYLQYAATLQQIFSPSPRLGSFGMRGLSAYYNRSGPAGLMIATYGVVLTAMALFGLAVYWRRRGTRPLGLFWLGCTIMALGTGIVIGARRYVPLPQNWHGLSVSMLMPYTWLVRIQFLSSFREPNRMLELGLVPAALLAGAAVDWLRYHAAPLLAVVLTLAVFEAGCGGAGFTPQITMPTAMPALDRPIAADHSGSIVVDVPFGVRSGAPIPGQGPRFNPEVMLQATADGHPRAVGYVSRLPMSSLAASDRQPFYADLLDVQKHPRLTAGELLTTGKGDAVRLAAARLSARSLGIGWAIVWGTSPAVPGYRRTPQIIGYLTAVGFRFDYRADGALVYRMIPVIRR
jgi:hypothetical protein